MANYGKRMVPEYLVKGLEEAYAKTSGGTGSTINLLENIVDSKGNKRFIEGIGAAETIEGLTVTFNKWSLSGTHLMLVFSFELAENTTIPALYVFNYYTLPKWIHDKLPILFGSRTVIEVPITLYEASGTSNSTSVRLFKETANKVSMCPVGNLAATTYKKYCRIQIDLLVDTE